MRRTLLPLLMLIGSPAVAQQDDGGYIFEHNERKPEEMAEARAKVGNIEVVLPNERLSRLPKTTDRLVTGKPLRIIMLGDSIINDTARSAWHERLTMYFPIGKVVRVVSVRGGTGCWWYKEAGRIARYVLQQKPDLVIIGGISQRGDIDSIRDCIRQIRAGSSAEIFLMTGPFGQADPTTGPDWRKSLDGGKDEKYAKELKALADEVGAEYFDLQLAWGDALRKTGKPLTFFKRDAVHANAEGEALLGMILEQYFAPRP